MNPKFIIENGKLKMGRVGFHKEMATNWSDVIGGGWFRKNEDEKTMLFHDRSIDFGSVTFEQIKECFDNGNIPASLDGYKCTFQDANGLHPVQPLN